MAWLRSPFIAETLAIVGIPAYLLATNPKLLPIAMPGIVALVLARRLALKVLRNRTRTALRRPVGITGLVR